MAHPIRRTGTLVLVKRRPAPKKMSAPFAPDGLDGFVGIVLGPPHVTKGSGDHDVLMLTVEGVKKITLNRLMRLDVEDE